MGRKFKMAASVSRIFSNVFHTYRNVASQRILPSHSAGFFPTSTCACPASNIRFQSTQTDSTVDPDDLYKFIDVEVKGHDRAVLDSYEKFVRSASQELELDLMEVVTPKKYIYRRTLLKSAHVHKKHRVQYEIISHYKVFKYRHMTGSTASTALEYIQRNLPEGVAMKVTKHQIEKIPEHISPPQQGS